LPIIKICPQKNNKVRKFRKIRETHVWWGTTFGSLLFFGLIFSLSYSLSFFIILSFYVLYYRKIGVSEVGEKSGTCVKKKYNGFWLKVK
jgi:hypothetical protein